MKIKLAEALLRRKELATKVDALKALDPNKLFQVRVKRVNVAEGIDEVTASVPKITAEQATAALDATARKLRMIDAYIQQANWLTEIEIDPSVMQDYVEPKT